MSVLTAPMTAALPHDIASLVREHYRPVLRLALGLSGNPHDAEDIAQEVFVEVIKALPGFRGDAAPGTWIYRITIRVAGRYISRRRPTEELPATLRAADVPLPIDLLRALGQLPFSLRMVVLLVGVEGQTHAEAAQLLGVAEGTVSSRMHRARAALSELMNA